MFSSIKFDLPSPTKSIIKVIGVGGGGSNAVSHMYNQGIKDVEFIICNTDKQALNSAPVPVKLQIGTTLTEGLGAGANPERGKQAALESKEDIRELLGAETKMVFITAGMGGGTGTGAAPVIAKIAKEMDILTVGIVTAPFIFEGKKKRQQAEDGIKSLSENCDTILVILNDRLREMFGNLPIRQAFAKADNVLSTAAKSIAEIITVTSDVNVDFEDVKTVMKNSGAAVMGSAITEGEGRALRAAEESLLSPLLNNTDIHGAQKVLLSIMSGEQAELEMDELTEITEYIQEKAGDEADVIFGHGIDPTLGQSIRVTVIATGFAKDAHHIVQLKKTTIDLESGKPVERYEEPEIQAPIAAEPYYARPVTPVAPAAPVMPQAQAPAPAPAPVVIPNPVAATPITPTMMPPMAPPAAPAAPSAPTMPSAQAQPEPAPVRKPIVETPRIVVDINSSPDVFQSAYPAADSFQPREDVREQERQSLHAKALERKDRLKKLSLDIQNEAYKDKLEVPAYLRRNIALDAVAHSSERSISRYKLNDDNELLGDNRFLHDNVD